MSEFQLSSFVQSLFAGYGEAKKDQQIQNRFNELEWTPFLFSSNYLNEMYSLASTKEQHESILSHLYGHASVIEGISSYKDIENKIIDKYYEPKKQRAQLYLFRGGKK